MGWERPRIETSSLLCQAMVCLGAALSVCAMLPLTNQQNQNKPPYNRGPLSCESGGHELSTILHICSLLCWEAEESHEI